MFDDMFFQWINSLNVPWFGIVVIYALSDYLFNIVMCPLMGGFANVEIFSLRKRRFLRLKQVSLAFHQFTLGARERLREFFQDRLSWLWPMTVLAPSTAVYLISKQKINLAVKLLHQSGLQISDYRMAVFAVMGTSVQHVVWGVAFVLAVGTFIRYRRRSETTWFSKSITYHFLRTMLFDFVISYVVLSSALQWIDFATALFRMLKDDSIVYPVFHSDLLYGLKPAFDATMFLTVLFLIVSLTPTTMLLREKDEKYSWMYYWLVYGCIVIVAITGGILLVQFNQRLEAIQKSNLQTVIQNFHLDNIDGNHGTGLIIGLEYYRTILNLPSSLPIPQWIKFLFSGRVLILALEIYENLAKAKDGLSLANSVPKILKAIL
ncbi:MAG: hypothetical protein D6694_14785 [Gammaproteobacteria bacterium]|nr:MAG: hypothetical protein D6694_14785 [Gammaproteobacteria bacterium]